jgi:hypothetical protein
MRVRFVDSFVIFEYTIVHCYEYDVIDCIFLFSLSFLTNIVSILGIVQIITRHQRKFLLIFFRTNKF